MKKLLLIALLLLFITTPCSAKASHNVQKTSATVKTKKPSKPKSATFKKRSSATLVNIAFFMVLALGIHVIKQKNDKNGNNFLGKNAKYLHFILLFLLELFSIGRYYCNLKVVDISGKEATFPQKLVRALVKFPVLLVIALIFTENKQVHLVIDGIMILWILAVLISMRLGADYRGLPDWIANTVVVEADKTAAKA